MSVLRFFLPGFWVVRTDAIAGKRAPTGRFDCSHALRGNDQNDQATSISPITPERNKSFHRSPLAITGYA